MKNLESTTSFSKIIDCWWSGPLLFTFPKPGLDQSLEGHLEWVGHEISGQIAMHLNTCYWGPYVTDPPKSGPNKGLSAGCGSCQ